MNDLFAQIESAVSGNAKDMRTVLQGLVQQVSQVSQNSGTAWLQPGGTPTNAGTGVAPAAGTLTVSAANGVFTLTIANAPQSSNATVWHEISYSAVKGFTSGVTTMAPTAATSVTVQAPGATYFFRLRSSYDRVNWSSYALASTTAASAGLVSSAAVSAGGTFNQTNYGVVDSLAEGSVVTARVYGAGGPNTSQVAVKGATETVLPSATIVNVPAGSTQFVGWDGEQYQLRSTLAAVLADNMTPIGKLAVVGTGAPTLPVILPVVNSGAVISYNVTNQGNGITGPLTLTVTDPGGSGSGATTGTQTISGGKLISVAPGNAGANYDSHAAVTVSGGVNPGTPGGGTAVGGNGGRMTAV